MPYIHAVHSTRYAEIFNSRIIRGGRVEHVVEICAREVGVGGRIEDREEEGGKGGR